MSVNLKFDVNGYERFKTSLDLFISYGTAEMKLAILTFLYCEEHLEIIELRKTNHFLSWKSASIEQFLKITNPGRGEYNIMELHSCSQLKHKKAYLSRAIKYITFRNGSCESVATGNLNNLYVF